MDLFICYMSLHLQASELSIDICEFCAEIREFCILTLGRMCDIIIIVFYCDRRIS